MAYKDEYEVARLYTDGSFAKKVVEKFDGDFALEIPSGPADLRASATRRPATCRSRNSARWMIQRLRRPGQAEVPARHARSIRSAAPRSAGPSGSWSQDYLGMIDQRMAGLKAAQIPLLAQARPRARGRSAASATSRKPTSSRRRRETARPEAELENSRFAAAAE